MKKFTHASPVVSKVCNIFSRISIDKQNNIYGHHAEGLKIAELELLQQKDTNTTTDFMSFVLPEAIDLPLTKGHKSNLITSNQIRVLADASEARFSGTLDSIAGAYIKFLCMPVRGWKTACKSMDNVGCEYRVLARNIIKNITRHGIHENDGAEFTLMYIGEFHAQSFEKRMSQKYPPKMYVFAKAGNGVVVEIKVADIEPFDRDRSLGTEAFVAALFQQATIISFEAGGDTGGYIMQTKKGESFK